MSINNYGFSMKEIKAAAISIQALKFNNIRVDSRRKTSHADNIELLKKLELKPLPTGSDKKVAKKPAKKKVVKKTAAKKLNKEKIADLTGITDAQVKKLTDLGIDSCAKLIDEDIKELSKLTKLTQKQIKVWCAEISE
jgi:hypothetical protein